MASLNHPIFLFSLTYSYLRPISNLATSTSQSGTERNYTYLLFLPLLQYFGGFWKSFLYLAVLWRKYPVISVSPLRNFDSLLLPLAEQSWVRDTNAFRCVYDKHSLHFPPTKINKWWLGLGHFACYCWIAFLAPPPHQVVGILPISCFAKTILLPRELGELGDSWRILDELLTPSSPILTFGRGHHSHPNDISKALSTLNFSTSPQRYCIHLNIDIFIGLLHSRPVLSNGSKTECRWASSHCRKQRVHGRCSSWRRMKSNRSKIRLRNNIWEIKKRILWSCGKVSVIFAD